MKKERSSQKSHSIEKITNVNKKVVELLFVQTPFFIDRRVPRYDHYKARAVNPNIMISGTTFLTVVCVFHVVSPFYKDMDAYAYMYVRMLCMYVLNAQILRWLMF